MGNSIGIRWVNFYNENILSYFRELNESPFKMITFILDIAIVIFLFYCFFRMVKGSREWQLLKGILLLIVVIPLFLTSPIAVKSPLKTLA